MYPVSGCVLVGRHYNEGGDKAGNIPPGYNSTFVALDKDGKAQISYSCKNFDRTFTTNNKGKVG